MIDPTPEQIEAAGYAIYVERYGEDSGWNKWKHHYLPQARAALMAAAGAAPQEAKREDMITAIAGGTITVPGGYGELQRDDAENIIDALMPTLATPVQVDEAKLAEVIFNAWYGFDPRKKSKPEREAAKAVAEWLRGGGQ